MAQALLGSFLFYYLSSSLLILHIMNLLLQINPQDCIDCVEHGMNKNLPELITCIVTIGVAAIIRAIEKRRIEKANRKK
jgi:hypothetical protein